MTGLIGKKVEVVSAQNKTLTGLKGEVVDETKSLLVLDTGKKLMKVQVSLKIGGQTIDGKNLVGLPHERIKK